MSAVLAMLKDPNFCELRNSPMPVFGEPQGPSQQRPVIRWIPRYQVAWRVAEGYCRWAYAPTLDELPSKVAAKDWE